MSLFKSEDIAAINLQQPMAIAGAQSFTHSTFTAAEQTDSIEKNIGALTDGQSCCFMTYGAWSSVDLLEYLLQKSGPANVYFSTWSIAAESITRIATWQKEGLITDLHVIVDAGLRNRKPDLYQLAVGSFANLKVSACHAKATVIQNEAFNLVVIASANYTKNPRIETGVIIYDKAVADFNIKWIMEEFAC